MRYLVDTHTFPRVPTADPRLSEVAKTTVRTPSHGIYSSIASAWEITIKVSKARLQIDLPLQELFTSALNQLTIQLLDISLPHLHQLEKIPQTSHKDPFDRLIVAQSLSEGWPLISADSALDAYGVNRIW